MIKKRLFILASISDMDICLKSLLINQCESGAYALKITRKLIIMDTIQ